MLDVSSEKSLEEWKIKARIFENAKYQEGYCMILWKFPQRKKKLEFVLNIYFYNWCRRIKYDSVVMPASSVMYPKFRK